MKALAAAYDRALGALTALVGVLIVAAMLLVSIDVVARYFFNRPMAWIFEATEFAMLMIPFLGMAWLIGRDGHVRIDIVINSLPPRVQAGFDLVTSVLATAACAAAAYYGVLSTASHFRRGVLTYGLYPIEKGWLIAVIALGFTLATIEFARRVVRRLRGLSGDPTADDYRIPTQTPTA